MRSALLCASSAEKIFLFAAPKRLRAFRSCFFTGGVVAGNGSCCTCSPGGAVAQRLRGFKSAEPEKTVKRSSRRTGVNLQFFPVEPSSLGLKGASSPFFVAPARRNRCDLAVLNAQHLLRKPVCDLKAPLGLSCLAGTAALFFSFGVKREHPRQPPLAQRSVFTLRWRLRKQKKQNAQVPKNLCVMAGVVSFELTARGFGDRCSTS